MARWVESARAELESGSQTRLAAYLGRARRDRRFDALVSRYLAAGQPVPAGDIDRIIGRYADRLLALRGETIARTETLQAVNAASDEAVRQAVDAGSLKDERVVKVWHTAGDSRVRRAHSAINGQRVDQEAAFVSGTGRQLRYPGDTGLGAGAADVINCRCWVEYEVDWLRQGEAAAR